MLLEKWEVNKAAFGIVSVQSYIYLSSPATWSLD